VAPTVMVTTFAQLHHSEFCAKFANRYAVPSHRVIRNVANILGNVPLCATIAVHLERSRKLSVRNRHCSRPSLQPGARVFSPAPIIANSAQKPYSSPVA
jgi:hypothetical protein